MCDSSVRENCTMKCDSNKLMKFLDAPNDIPLSTYSEILDNKSFWIYLILFNLAWTAFAICVVMSDTICFKLLGNILKIYSVISYFLFLNLRIAKNV